MVFLYGTGEYPNYRAALSKINQQVLISRDVDQAKNCRGLLLPGGGDIHDKLDGDELATIGFFAVHHLPILGICRGMQALNVYFGGSLYDYIPNHQIRQGDIYHPTYTADVMKSLLGSHPTVNSNHHQAIKDLGYELHACQWAPDGIIEAVRHRALPILGVQWHPERCGCGDVLFRRFAEEMQK